MELILINSGKLKIMLTDDEMKKYDLDTDTIDYDTTSTRRAFWSILDDAKTQTGFDAASDRVFIQLYPSKKGGCEMYVTKLGEACQPPRAVKNSRGVHMVTERHESGRERLVAYSFDAMETMLSVCRRLLFIGWHGSSQSFRDRGGRCFLFLSTALCGGIGYLDRLSFIGEYGTFENPKRLGLYVSEHGSCICENGAVERLGVL